MLLLPVSGLAAYPVSETSAGVVYDSLTDNRDNWYQSYVSFSRKKSKREVYYGTLRYVDRLTEAESEVEAGLYFPATRTGVLFAELTASSDHVILPTWRGTLEWQQAMGKSWVIHGGYRHTEYELGDLKSVIAAIDYYYGDWRVSYRGMRSELEQDNPRTVNQVDLGYYYGSFPSSLVLRYVDGEESEIIDQTLAILTTEVRSLQLIGRHELNKKWMLLFRTGKTEQGDLYDRTSVELGLLFRH